MFSINSLFREKRTKAKLLLRELKTVKADFAFAKERCTQLEDKNRILRASREKDDNTEDDDLDDYCHEEMVEFRANKFMNDSLDELDFLEQLHRSS
ncbi:hypothetical protein ACS0TY_006077 [Phlomoides rotata]